MSTNADTRKQVRIVAFSAKNVQHLRTVNIVTSAPKDKHQAKECAQLTAAQAQSGVHPTFMDSGGSVKGLPTIYIAGYSGPN